MGREVAVGATGQPHPAQQHDARQRGLSQLAELGQPFDAGTTSSRRSSPCSGITRWNLASPARRRRCSPAFGPTARTRSCSRRRFPGQADPFSIDAITKALATFQRTIISGNAPYDRYLAGDRGAISESAVRGEALFFSERLECHHCHSSFNLSGSVQYVGKEFRDQEFFNNGLYNIGGTGAYPDNNRGIFTFTLKPEDMGRFKAPTLRNIAVTAPYMHDGSIATLDERDRPLCGGGAHDRVGTVRRQRQPESRSRADSSRASP